MNLVYSKERVLFVIALTISICVWLAVVAGTLGIALIYMLMFFVFYLFAHSAFISWLKGTGVEISATQFPDLHQRIGDCCSKLEIAAAPEAYLIHANGVFNALATRFLGRDFMVLFADVVDALEEHPDAINFYIGHELGHIRRKHILWSPVLAPALLLPLLGAGYSRAREYTCDRHGLAACGTVADAQYGLAALAAGGRRWRDLDKNGYAAQAKKTGGFWMSLHELVGDYPWLTKRMATITALGNNRSPDHPRRNPLAWLLALFVPRLGVSAGGSGASLIVFVAIIGVLAAVAVPAYQDFTKKAEVASAYAQSAPFRDGVYTYVVKHSDWPNSNGDLNLPATSNSYGRSVRSISVGDNGTITIEFAGLLAGSSLVLEPEVKESRLYWTCSSKTIARKMLPRECR